MAPKKYSLRSVKAEQLTHDPEKAEEKSTNASKLAEWSGGSVDWVERDGNRVPQVVITSRTGTRVANVGDYVVELSSDNFTVMSEAEFDRTYES